MKHDDIGDGGLYAYTEARPVHELRAWYRPYLILSTRPHTYEERQPMQDATGRLVPAPPGARVIRARSPHEEPVGLPAVYVITEADDPDFGAVVDELRARREELLAAFRHAGTVTGRDGRELGSYALVTSLTYLHGGFAALLERKAELQAQDDAAQRQQDAEKAAGLARYQDLARRLSALGIVVDPNPVYRHVPETMTLPFEDITVLVSLAEYARQESRS